MTKLASWPALRFYKKKYLAIAVSYVVNSDLTAISDLTQDVILGHAFLREWSTGKTHLLSEMFLALLIN
jgi:hypothetical protein